MSAALLKAAIQLPPKERLALIGQIWDSLNSADAGELSPAQMRELDQRVDRLAREGSQGEEWSIVKKRILERRRPK